jgi:hypothetical protein
VRSWGVRVAPSLFTHSFTRPHSNTARPPHTHSPGLQLPDPRKLLSALRPRSLVSLAQGQGKRVQRLVWRLEDASVFTAKFAVKAAAKGVRPALVCE